MARFQLTFSHPSRSCMVFRNLSTRSSRLLGEPRSSHRRFGAALEKPNGRRGRRGWRTCGGFACRL